MADRISDKPLCCSSCGDAFVFTSGEQELFRLRGISREPEQCPTCVRARVLVATGGTKRTTGYSRALT